MSAANLLSDAETCMVASQQKRDIGLAREAHDFVDLYFEARNAGEPEPWPGADGDAQDIEQQSVQWEQILTAPKKKKVASSDVGSLFGKKREPEPIPTAASLWWKALFG